MEMQKQTSKEYLNSLSILHIALMAGQLMFAGVAYFLHQSGGFESPASELSPILKVLVPIFVSSAIVGSYFLFILELRNQTSDFRLQVSENQNTNTLRCHNYF